MESGRRKLLALGILVGGLGLAWLVRPSADGSAFAPWWGGGKLIIRKENPPARVEPRAESALPLPDPSSGSLTSVSGKPSRSVRKDSSAMRSGGILPGPPPALAPTFPSWEAKRIPSEAGMASLADSAPCRHRIVDGDTLESLAERYLGSRALAIEIYEANRAVIPHPHLLPIGVEIVIPSARSVRITPLAQLEKRALVPLPEAFSGSPGQSQAKASPGQ